MAVVVHDHRGVMEERKADNKGNRSQIKKSFVIPLLEEAEKAVCLQ